MRVRMRAHNDESNDDNNDTVAQGQQRHCHVVGHKDEGKDGDTVMSLGT